MAKHAHATLPDLSHFLLEDANHVYEPSDDTFLLCDALEADRQELREMRPCIALEIGPGSGCVISFLALLLQSEGIPCHFLAADVNPKAVAMTRKTASVNQVCVDCVLSDLASNVVSSGIIDILLFNPPYVPTPSEEVCLSGGLSAAWAGGENGRVVIDRFLPRIKAMLSPMGRCYLVLVEENKPREIARILLEHGLSSEIVIKRRAVNEGLMVMRIRHQK